VIEEGATLRIIIREIDFYQISESRGLIILQKLNHISYDPTNRGQKNTICNYSRTICNDSVCGCYDYLACLKHFI